MPDEYSFNWPNFDLPRKAYRISLPGLVVWIKEKQHFFVVEDISACGVAFRPFSANDSFQVNQQLSMSIYFKKRLIVKDLLAKVVRRAEKIIACEFDGLDHRQEYRLDKFVLEVQKTMINKRKKAEKSWKSEQDE